MNSPQTALHFSGGKDSLATLYLMEDSWPEILVVWLNTGAAFPETEKFVREVAKQLPHFLEITTDVISDLNANGLPTDVLPIANTAAAESISGSPLPLRLRSWIDCCSRNIWFPMSAKMQELGIRKVIRGTRLAEPLVHPSLKSGAVFNGIEYIFPILSWSDEEVDSYLESKGLSIPSSISHLPHSLDCWCCTAYLEHHAPIIQWMERAHPEKHRQVHAALSAIREATTRSLFPLHRLTSIPQLKGEPTCPTPAKSNDALSKESSPAPSRKKASPGTKPHASRNTPTPSRSRKPNRRKPRGRK